MSAREGNQDPGLRAYLATLEASSRTHPRYNWLKGYFQQDPEFEKERLYPFVPGRTRTIVANFFEPPIPPTISCPATLEELDQTLSTRSSEAAVRLIFVTAISGVDEQVRIAQLLGTARGRNLRERLSSDELAPVVTRARTAGDSTTLLHPFHGHSSYLPDPKVLSRIAAATKVEPGILLRHLDQQEHLVYRSHTWTRHETQADENTGRWLDFSLGVDQQNFITAAMLTKTLGHLRGTNKYRHTLLMLATEDNCLGIDFNKFASALDQPAVSYDGTPHQAFEAILRFMSEEKLRSILVNPLGLVWDYTAGLSKAFACQVELYRRKWICLYEPYANTSAVYGDAESRDHVRKEAKLLSRHLQYLHQSLSNLRQIMAGTQRNSRPGIKIETNETVRAFKDVSRLLEPLKSAYDNFIEQQVSKISLHETRQSMTEARDLQRLSYLGFVFAPLSLASSFFSINIRPLGGQASLWSFVVTSMSTLCLSILVLLSLNSRIHQKVFRSSQSGQPRFVSGHARSKEPGLPETKTMHPSPNLQKQDIETGQPLSELVSHMTGQTAAPSQLAAGVEPSSAWAPARKPARIPPNDSERSWEWERLWGRENQITVPHAPPVRIEYADPPYRGTISNVITAVSAQRPSSQLERLVYTMPPPPNISLSVSSNASKSSCTSKRTEKSLQPVNSNEYIPKAKRALSSEGGSITNDRVLDMTPCTVVKSTPQVISLASKSSTSNRSNDNAVLRKMEDGPVEIGDTEQNQENPDTSTFAFGMAQMWKSSHPDDGRKWWPGDEEVSMFIMLKRLCEERDAAEIKRTVSLRPWWRSNLKFDIIYGLALVEAACHLLIDALPVFYSAIKNRKIRIECLATALGMTIGDSEGHLATLQWLGIRGVRLNIWYEKFLLEHHLLSRASIDDCPEAARLLLDLDANPNSTTAEDGGDIKSEPLQCAAMAGHLSVLNVLLEAGAYANDPAAMHIAASHGHLHIIKALVTAGANVSDPTSVYDDAFCAAAEEGHWDVLTYMLELQVPLNHYFPSRKNRHGDVIPGTTRGEEAMNRVAKSTKASTEVMCLELLNKGVDPEFTSYNDQRRPQLTASIAYIYAALAGRVELLRHIMVTGTDPNPIAAELNLYFHDHLPAMSNGMSISDIFRSSMLALACGAGRTEAAAMLLQHGANVNYGGEAEEGPPRQTPLHLAAKYGHVEVVDLLLANGADIHARATSEGITPIHAAASAGSINCVRRLLERGDSLEARDNQGQTPLIIAARGGEQSRVEQLLDQGAVISATDAEGWTAAHRAAWNGHKLVLKLLEDRGADLEATTNDGFTINDLLQHHAQGEALIDSASE